MLRRRIVTGCDAQGASVIVSDGPWPGQLDRGAQDYRDDLWLITELSSRLMSQKRWLPDPCASFPRVMALPSAS